MTEAFDLWLRSLRDDAGRGRILARVERMRMGNFGDAKPVGGAVRELRISGRGPGYRVYFTVRGAVVVVLLCGGSKSSQASDISRARQMASRLE